MKAFEMGEGDYPHSEITKHIIGAFYAVYNSLGYGFLEKVYENALGIELAENGMKVEQQKSITVTYKKHLVGEYYADLLVEDCVLVEIKAANALAREHEAQLLNYLKATPYEVGLLLNFGPSPQVKRLAYANNRKVNLNKSSN